MRLPNSLRFSDARSSPPKQRSVGKLPLTQRVAALVVFYFATWFVVYWWIELAEDFSSDVGPFFYVFLALVAVAFITFSYRWYGRFAPDWTHRVARTFALVASLAAVWMGAPIVAVLAYQRFTGLAVSDLGLMR